MEKISRKKAIRLATLVHKMAQLTREGDPTTLPLYHEIMDQMEKEAEEILGMPIPVRPYPEGVEIYFLKH